MDDTDETENTNATSHQPGDALSSSPVEPSAVELESPSSKGSEDRIWSLMQLFEKLLREGEKGTRHRPYDFSDPEWSSSLMAAAKAADSMLRKVESGDYDIHAYQLFEEGIQLSAEKVASRFSEVGWEKFSSKNTVKPFFEELGRKMSEYADNVADRTPRLRNERADQAFQKIVSSLQPLLEDESISESFPHFRIQIDELLNRIVSRHQGLTQEEAMEMTFKHVSFIRWCFPIEKKGKKVHSKYRPYELFRYAALRGWNREKLIVTISDLNPGFVPNPARKPAHSFPIFEEDGPDYL